MLKFMATAAILPLMIFAQSVYLPGYGGTASPPVYSPPVYSPTALDGYSCTCNSTSKLEVDARSPRPSKVFLSNSANVTTVWVDALNPYLPKVTFVCACDNVYDDIAPQNYILSANQTDPTLDDASDCLGVELLQSICTGLEDLGLFTCQNVWRSGVAGTTSNNLPRNDALMEAVHKLCFALGGDCAKTIIFTDLVDDVLALYA